MNDNLKIGKWFSICLLILLVLSSCGKNDSNTNDVVSGILPENGGTMVSLISISQYFSEAVPQIEEGLNELQISFNTSACNNDDNEIIALLQAESEKGIKTFCVVFPPLEIVMNFAEKNDITVIFYTATNDYIEEPYEYNKHITISAGWHDAPRQLSEVTYKQLNADFKRYDLNNDGKISYIMMTFLASYVHPDVYSIPEELDKLLQSSGLGYLDYYDPNNEGRYQNQLSDKETARGEMEKALQTNPPDGADPIELLLSTNMLFAEGGVEALQSIGYNTSDPEKHIPVYSCGDLEPAIKEAIDRGEIDCTIYSDVDRLVKCLVQATKNAVEGNDLFDQMDGLEIDRELNCVTVPCLTYPSE